MPETLSFDDLTGVLDGYIECIRQSVAVRNGPTVPVDLYRPEIPSVLAGLLARQATLAMRLAQSPPTWDGHIAPLILRPMVECLVSFRWIIKDPTVRATEYVSYALGQAKLTLSKMQNEIEQREDQDSKENTLKAAQMQEAWILSQRLIQYVDVNLGSWAGMSIQKMCQETESEDLYNFWFVPHSACAHNTWHHVSIWNTRVCKNPLHHEHRLSHIASPDLTLAYVQQSSGFLSDLLEEFDRFYGVGFTEEDPFLFLERGLSSL